MKNILLYLLCLLALNSLGQNKVLVNGNTESKELKLIKISSPLRDCINGWTDIDQISIDSIGHFSKVISINKPSMIYFHCMDFIGAFVSPGDTLNITEIKLAKSVASFNGRMSIARNYEVSLSSSNPQNTFFSLMQKETGKLSDVPYSINDDISYPQMRELLKALYAKRLNFYEAYIKKYPNLSEVFKTTVLNEIKGQYYNQIIWSFHNYAKLDTNYINEVNKLDFSWKQVSASPNLMQASYSYFVYYLDNIPGPLYTATRFANKYNNIKTFIKDEQLKDYHLTALMLQFQEKEPDNYQEILEDYKKVCKNKLYVKSIDSMYQAYLTKVPPPSIQLSDSALAVKLTDLAGKEISLGDKLKQNKESLIFIDFWASWCGPCLMQIPYLKVLENKLGKKIVFISISEDKNKQSWENAVNENQLTGNQYVIDYLHRKALFKELDLKSIPRFILVKPNGEVINTRLPHPNEIERVSKIIDKALLNKKKF